MWRVAEHYRVRLGGNTYIDCRDLIVFRGGSLFNLRRHDDGYLGIDFDIYDQNGAKVATVRRNEVYMGNAEDYEIQGTMNRYTVTERGTGRVICDIRKREDADPDELAVTVHLYTPSGFLFDSTPDETNLGGLKLKNNVFRGSNTAIEIR
jgi:hypothetical protein